MRYYDKPEIIAEVERLATKYGMGRSEWIRWNIRQVVASEQAAERAAAEAEGQAEAVRAKREDNHG